MSRRAPPLAASLLLGLAACNDPALDGSISEAFDLSFSSMRIVQSENALQIDYLRSEGHELVIRLVVVTEGLDLTQEVELGGEYKAGHARATVSRAVDGEPVRVLPPVAKGVFELDGAPQIGKQLGGSFNLSFGQGGDVGSGRTLSGRFSATVDGGANADLSGTLASSLDLSFTSTRALLGSATLEIDFLRSDGRDVVMKLLVDTRQVDWTSAVQLGGLVAAGVPRATVSRSVASEAAHTFPPISSGKLNVDTAPSIGATLHGAFMLTFDLGGNVGSGRTLSAEFFAKVEAAP